ncbi:hypothetical protein QIL26_gp3 [ssRNA phage Esthiorhiza.4_10]|uniref:Uncharacterized protein n=1 Tax=ssRNA phage Esthiorhiza.4_10 TaxID=2786090 RepID=A0A8S5L286_9VIRU|nr:hypothetical protein QIL26_gp3 [ssRNA phage Esthiorhiza.4_10]DAD51950.1 TPA_asm: hypothetical protein [ssRNA phage Esthiorhiza.4_10]
MAAVLRLVVELAAQLALKLIEKRFPKAAGLLSVRIERFKST